MKKRSIIKAVILSIITFGLYGVYWYIKLVDEIKIITKDKDIPSGGMAVLITLLTLGLYGLYLWHKIGHVLFEKGISSKDRSLLYFILSFLILDLINLSIIQNEFNNL